MLVSVFVIKHPMPSQDPSKHPRPPSPRALKPPHTGAKDVKSPVQDTMDVPWIPYARVKVPVTKMVNAYAIMDTLETIVNFNVLVTIQMPKPLKNRIFVLDEARVLSRLLASINIQTTTWNAIPKNAASISNTKMNSTGRCL